MKMSAPPPRYSVLCLLSGGKDSILAMTEVAALGHSVVALANLAPPWEDDGHEKDENEVEEAGACEEGNETRRKRASDEKEEGGVELDSFMFQSAGGAAVPMQAMALRLPLYRRVLRRDSSRVTSLRYTRPAPGDEVEDMYELLRFAVSDAMSRLGVRIDCVCSGAVYSDYQRLRVEHVCARLGLVSLAPLWRRSEEQLLEDVFRVGIRAVLVKVACMGLMPRRHLGAALEDVAPRLVELKERFGASLIGEGGEFESLVIGHPAFSHQIAFVDAEAILLSTDESIAPPGVLHFSGVTLEEKDDDDAWQPLPNARLAPPGAPASTFMWARDEASTEAAMSMDGKMGSAVANDDDDNCDAESEVDYDGRWEMSIVESTGGNMTVGCRRAASASASTSVGAEAVGDAGAETAAALRHIERVLRDRGLSLDNIVYVHLYVSDMRDFARVNARYAHVMRRCARAPSRCCVEVRLPHGVSVAVDALAVRTPRTDHDVLHVASISHWAPACIGPYAQANAVGDVVFVAGQLGLRPISMDVPEKEAEEICAAMHSCDAVASAMGCAAISPPSSSAADNVLAWTVYTSGDSCSSMEAMPTFGPLAVHVCVAGLPKAARIELQPVLVRDRPGQRYGSDDDAGDKDSACERGARVSLCDGGASGAVFASYVSGLMFRAVLVLSHCDKHADEDASTKATETEEAAALEIDFRAALAESGLGLDDIVSLRLYHSIPIATTDASRADRILTHVLSCIGRSRNQVIPVPLIRDARVVVASSEMSRHVDSGRVSALFEITAAAALTI